MKGKQIKVEVLLGAVLMLVVTGAGGMLVRPAGEPDQRLRARIGDVVWNHDLHARMKEIASCTVCHHTERQGIVNPKPCGDCHTLFTNREAVLLADLFMEVEEKTYSGEQGPPAMEVFHNKCLGCHQAMSQGPVGCRDCHAQSFSGPSGIVEWDHRAHARKMEFTCVECHHKDTEALTDADYRACGACHVPAAQLLGLAMPTGIEKHENARHGLCFTCHSVYNPENDLRACKDCHAGLALIIEETADPEETPPSIETAIHGRCRECHNKAYRDLEPSMPIYCTDCHKPDPSLIMADALGPVLFSHKRHAEYGAWTCDKCHHTDVPGEPHTACRLCHGAGNLADIPGLEEAMHTRCLDGHKEEGVGLTQWESFRSEEAGRRYFQFVGSLGAFFFDHRFHAVGLSLSCRDCHHNTIQKDGVYATAFRIGRPWPEKAGFIQTCRNCHGEEGPVPGSVAEGTNAKNLEESFKKVCIECHRRLGCGPREWEAFFKRA